ncbi:MAG: prepilin peptidase [Emergencia sp.]
MTETLILIIKCLGAILLGILEGNGAVYIFNHLPAGWLCDYGEKPGEELLDRYTQRLKSYPWKYVFTMLFVILNIRMVVDDWQFAVSASVALWIMLEIAVSDIKYRIIPDQLVILLAVSALGFVTFHNGFMDCLLGGVCGFAIMFAVALVGKAVSKRDTLGGGDIKLFTALGMICGFTGILAVYALTALIAGGHMVVLLAMKKLKFGDTVPMAPYIGAAAAVYLVFLWGFEQILYL